MSAVSLADVKVYLGFTTSEHDAELPGYIDAAEALIAQRVGALVPISRTDRVAGATYALVLPTSPVVSVTSVTPVNGAALDVSDLFCDARAGVVTYDSGAGFPASQYDVVYEAGRSALPDDLVLAVKELVRHLFEPKRNGSANRAAPAEAPSAWLIPYRVAELIAPYTQAGVA